MIIQIPQAPWFDGDGLPTPPFRDFVSQLASAERTVDTTEAVEESVETIESLIEQITAGLAEKQSITELEFDLTGTARDFTVTHDLGHTNIVLCVYKNGSNTNNQYYQVLTTTDATVKFSAPAFDAAAAGLTLRMWGLDSG